MNVRSYKTRQDYNRPHSREGSNSTHRDIQAQIPGALRRWIAAWSKHSTLASNMFLLHSRKQSCSLLNTAASSTTTSGSELYSSIVSQLQLLALQRNNLSLSRHPRKRSPTDFFLKVKNENERSFEPGRKLSRWTYNFLGSTQTYRKHTMQ